MKIPQSLKEYINAPTINSYNKYSNQKTVIDNITFDSIHEAHDYAELKLQMKAGLIKDLKLQQKFSVFPSFTDHRGIRYQPIFYIADFVFMALDYRSVYGDTIKDKMVVRDSKGMRTEVYKLKKKLFLSTFHNYYFEES